MKVLCFKYEPAELSTVFFVNLNKRLRLRGHILLHTIRLLILPKAFMKACIHLRFVLK